MTKQPYAAGNAAVAQKNPLSLSGLKLAADTQDTNDSAQYAADNQALVASGSLTQADAIQKQRDDAMNKTAVKIMNPDMRLYTQSLKNAGVNKLRTGASAYGDDPGYFDLEGMTPEQRIALASLLKAGQ